MLKSPAPLASLSDAKVTVPPPVVRAWLSVRFPEADKLILPVVVVNVPLVLRLPPLLANVMPPAPRLRLVAGSVRVPEDVTERVPPELIVIAPIVTSPVLAI